MIAATSGTITAAGAVPGGPPGPRAGSRCFDFAGICVTFECSDESWLALLSQRFEGFSADAAPALTIRYAVVESIAPAPEGPYPALQATIHGTAEHGTIDLEGPAFTATADLAAMTVTIRGPRYVYPVDMVLRQLLPLLLRDGVVLHTAVVTDGRRAWACTGPSGSGKTTLARLLAPRALCDEMAALVLTGDGVEARALPYWEGTPGAAPLAGVYLLHHATEHRRTPVTCEAAMRALVGQMVWPMLSQAGITRCLSALAQVVECVPTWELAFAPRPDVAGLIMREA